MKFAQYSETEPVVEGFFDALGKNRAIAGSYQDEMFMRDAYSHFSTEQHKELYRAVKEELGLSGKKVYDSKDYRFFSDRLEGLFKNHNQRDNGSKSIMSPREMAKGFLELSGIYIDAAKTAYPSVTTKENHPFPQLFEIVSIADTPNFDLETEMHRFTYTDLILNHDHGSRLFSGLVESTDPNGKIVMLANKKRIGVDLLKLMDEKLREDPGAYPYRVIEERGAWSHDYFVGNYAKKTFKPHENMIQTHISKDLKISNKCKISMDQDNRMWLVQIGLSE